MCINVKIMFRSRFKCMTSICLLQTFSNTSKLHLITYQNNTKFCFIEHTLNILQQIFPTLFLNSVE